MTDAKPDKEYIDLLGTELKTGALYWLHPTYTHWEEMRANQIKHRDRWLAAQREKKAHSVEKDWDESKHPRDPAGSPTGGQFTSGGGGDGGGVPDDEDLRLVSYKPSAEQVTTWRAQLDEEVKHVELGGAEDGELQKMMGALDLYARIQSGDFKSEREYTLSVVYDGNKKLLSTAMSKIDNETKVAEIVYAGGTKADAMVKALTMTIGYHENKAERIEANDWADDPFSMQAYLDAGFRKEGDAAYGVQTFAWGAATPTKGQLAKLERESRDYSQQILGASKAAARLLGYNPAKVKVSEEDHPFKIGGETGVRHAAGLASLDTGEITIFPKQIFNTDAAVSVMAHEVAHQKYERVLNAYIADRKLVWDEVNKQPPDTVMNIDGSLRPPYDKKYPLYTRLYKYESSDEIEKRTKSDGITDYSRAYWEQNKPGTPNRVSLHLAQHETIAEMARVLTDTGKLEGKPAWRAYYRDIDKSYDELKKAGLV